MNLRKLAQGKPCLVRSPACNNNPETTVLAHIRQIGISGLGIKAPDLLGSWCCSACHSYVDQETKANREARELLLYRGMARTIYQLIKDGVIDSVEPSHSLPHHTDVDQPL